MVLIGLILFIILLVLGAIVCFKLPRNVALAVATSLWLLYGVYEYMMQSGMLCSGECNIRVDLLLIYPILFIVTIAALVRVVKTFRAPQSPNVTQS